jgi:hypothetical protein
VEQFGEPARAALQLPFAVKRYGRKIADGFR